MSAGDIHRIGEHKEAEAVSDTQDFEYEEVSSDEVDNVVAALENLSETVTSEAIKDLLEECLNSVYCLVYEDDDEVSSEAA
ncbi:MAG: hypothetical protein AABP62_09340 [Planctomycetota bacterium]